MYHSKVSDINSNFANQPERHTAPLATRLTTTPRERICIETGPVMACTIDKKDYTGTGAIDSL
jgi:hypothetical protein